MKWRMTKNIHRETEKVWSQQIITKKWRYEDLETQIMSVSKTKKKGRQGDADRIMEKHKKMRRIRQEEPWRYRTRPPKQKSKSF